MDGRRPRGRQGALNEAVVLPMLVPELFTGIRARGACLAVRPAGHGQDAAGQGRGGRRGATFFNVSAATLASKHRGESEKLAGGAGVVLACREASMMPMRRLIDGVDPADLAAVAADLDNEPVSLADLPAALRARRRHARGRRQAPRLGGALRGGN
ncbi:microtubule-severing ATPase [Aureococcus anophagefferens]|nr:microtubule-severing ATPase [Aureococcus anophagefferens]